MENKIEVSVHNLSTIGYLMAKLPDEQLAPVFDEAFHIMHNFDKATPYNKDLAGNLEHEYLMHDCKNHVFDMVMPLVNAMDDIFQHNKDFQVLNKSCDYMLQSLWVNYQKKHEFNPTHMHSGIYSFVIWLKVPYKIDDEIARSSSRNARMRCPAHFQFSYTDTMGQISHELIPVDETYEGVICIFPAKMNHQVYPFYTSDDYRISVSGNICFKVGE